MPEPIGPLAAALAKAQTQFPPVVKDKKVTKGSFSYMYAPLDSILGAVRGPLSDNGLVVVQILDDGALVTSLIHKSGAILSGSIDIPTGGDIQALGSAITYLRRYAIQAMLGIAAEDDDDGNRAAGNKIVDKPKGNAEKWAGDAFADSLQPDRDPGGLIGFVKVGKTRDTDYELRETPEGWALGFRLESDAGGVKVLARDAIALGLAASAKETVGARVTCWGRLRDEKYTTKSGYEKRYQVLDLERISGPAGMLPAEEAAVIPVAPGQAALPLEALDPEERLIQGAS